MPPTTENIADRPGFDVYGAILVLSFLATLGAALLMRQELADNWGWSLDKTSPEFTSRAVHITEMNKDPQKYQNYVQVTDTDLKEWHTIKGKDAVFPVKDFEWPKDYDPLENPVKPGANNLDIPEVQRNALMKDYQPAAEGVPPVEKEKPVEPVPAPTEKKEDVKKEEPKTETAPAPADKKGEPKKEETKTEPAPAPADKKEEPKKEEAKKE